MDLPVFQGLLTEVVRAGAAPGASIALSVRGTRASYESGIASTATGAPMTSSSRFQLGCITKLLTSIVALELFVAHKLHLDAPISRYLPELQDIPKLAATSVQHLLSHTSGYQGINIADPLVRHYFGWPQFLDLLRAGVQLFAPGATFNYEHTEYVLLGAILERVTGEKLGALYQALIFDPLSIECGSSQADAAQSTLYVANHSFDAATKRFAPLRDVPYSAFWNGSLSELTLSPRDLVTLGEAIAGFGAPIFSSATVEMLREEQIVLPTSVGGRRHEAMPLAFGHGCARYDTSVFGHNGSARGQTCALRFDTSTGLVLAVGLNSWQPHTRDILCRKVINMLSPAPAVHRRSEPVWNFADLPGTYRGARGAHVEVSASEAHLTCTICSTVPQSAVRVVIARAESGYLDVRADLPHLTIGFFGAQEQRSVMVGLNAYRRADS